MATTVFDVLIKKLGEQASSAKVFLVAGNPKDYPAYRESVGFIRGLETSKQIVEDLQRNFMKEEDDD
tara:strand:+ start:71 stop:271 length:201 start_codon:yes stop_codon:yes gene_type:complete